MAKFDVKAERVILSRLARQFGGIQPFTVLDTKGGEWQERKRQWVRLGIKSELGRGENLVIEDPNLNDVDLYRHRSGAKKAKSLNIGTHPYDSYGCKKRKIAEEKAKLNGLTFRSTGFCAEVFSDRGGGTSIFDPTLCEITYHWFCPAGGAILDPFAGGSVRGVVAAVKGYRYIGVDLRQEQLDANIGQWKSINERHGPFPYPPRWVLGDATELRPKELGVRGVDLVFTCPPYGDLEVYSNDPKDLSTMAPDEFDEAYATAIRRAYQCLRVGGFACFVVADYRDKQGFYRCLPELTVQAALSAGFKKYNEAILLNAIGSLPVRTGKQFKASRKLGKCHQNVLVFFKGTDPKGAAKRINKGG